MRLRSCQSEPEYATADVTVSRRNLLTLLARTHGEDRRQTTLTQSGTLKGKPYHLAITPETDAAHYPDRKPGHVDLDSAVVLQVATDLIQQVADSLPADEDFAASILDRLATQIAYVNINIDHRKVSIV
jgi:hypothetical protein